jgi:hypothetical protein
VGNSGVSTERGKHPPVPQHPLYQQSFLRCLNLSTSQPFPVLLQVILYLMNNNFSFPEKLRLLSNSKTFSHLQKIFLGLKKKSLQSLYRIECFICKFVMPHHYFGNEEYVVNYL